MPTRVTTSAFISVDDNVIRTRTDEAGLTEGNVAKLVRPPASLSTLKSPAAIVGLDLNDPGLTMSSRAIRIRKSSFFFGGLYGAAMANLLSCLRLKMSSWLHGKCYRNQHLINS